MSVDTGSRPSTVVGFIASMDRSGAPRRRIRLSSRPSAPRPPARLHGLVDLCLRRADRGRPGMGHHHRLRPRRHGAELVARLVRGTLRELAPPVERRGVLLLHGDPSLGQVLHGGLAGEPPTDLGHRGHLISRVGGRRLHRLPHPAELRFTVDLDPGQRRHQRHRGRGLLERSELWADAHVAHRPAADRGHADRGSSCPPRAASWHRPAVRSRGGQRRCRGGRPGTRNRHEPQRRPGADASNPTATSRSGRARTSPTTSSRRPSSPSWPWRS